MKIRNKILIYFSCTVIALTGFSLAVLYVLFSEYREEEFQQRQRQKIGYTVGLIFEYREMSENLAMIMDELSIHDFFDEKMMIFDNEKDLLFSSIDDLPIAKTSEVLNALSPARRWIETKEGRYDVIGVYLEQNQSSYYAISKAYDAFGYAKLNFLRNVLMGMFMAISAVVVLVSLYLSNLISKPIRKLAENLGLYNVHEGPNLELKVETTTEELQYLTGRFNEQLKRVREAFAFQKHTVHHISHELKTPISVLVSELEKMRNHTDPEQIKPALDEQIAKTKSLGNIINVLLEISKIESGGPQRKAPIRMDELVFDIMEELNMVHPGFHFEVHYAPEVIDERKLIVIANEVLMKQAFQNIMSNCIIYSDDAHAAIHFDCASADMLRITFANRGAGLDEEEQKFLFDYFFRGRNSHGKMGFGLGLVLTKKIIDLSGGHISYTGSPDNRNTFELHFPLS